MAATEGGKLTGLVADPAASPQPAQSAGASASAPTSSSKSATQTSSWKGRRIRRFKLIDELGEGAMGRVFVAEDTMLRRHVAMKLLPSKHRDGRPNHRTERLITEARSAATLEHPNVVTIHEIDQSGGVHYIAMELVEGGNLERLVQMSGPMEIERACQLVAEAAEALAHAHSRGIVHRDVKPANLLLTRSGRCKVCDFGLAMVETPEGDATKMRCVGTPYFISPEVAMGKGATELSDLYSLGCTLFFLLTGRPPFPGTSSRQVLKMHVNDPLPDLRRWRADAPDRLIEALEKACAKNPKERFANAERFGKLLRTFTITPGGSAGVVAPIGGPPALSHHANSSNFAMNGISGQMTPLAAAPMMNPGMSGMNPEAQSPFSRPVVWAGVATLATAGLIALGMWLVRPGLEKAKAAGPAAPPVVVVAPQNPSGEPSLFAASPAATSASATPQAAAPAKPALAATPAPAVPAAPVASTATNLLVNGSMEDADTDDGLAGWFIHERFKHNAQIVREGSNRFLRLTNDDAAKTVFADQKIDIDPTWKAITVSAKMRATNFKVGKTASQDGRVAFAFHDSAGARVGSWPPVPNVRTDSGWVERTVTADVPAGAKTLYVQLAIFNALGSVDFDDVTITPQK